MRFNSTSSSTATKSSRTKKAAPRANAQAGKPAWPTSGKATPWWVTRLDRLTRSTFHLCQIADDLEHQHVSLHGLDYHIDTRDATGHLLFNMLGAIAQFETQIRAERQMDGIQKAKTRGVHFGPKKRLTPEQVTELRQRRAQGDPIKTLMQAYGLSKTSVYR